MSFHTKTGNVHLLPSKRSKVLVQAVLKQDVLQILKQNVLKTLNIEIEHERRVLLQRGEDGLGIYITGGTDYKIPVCVHKLMKGYPAIASRQVFEGDIILSINGESVQDKNHNEAVDLLKNAGKYVTLHLAKIKAGELDDDDDDDDDEPVVKKQNNKEDWIVSEEIPLTTASITKYENGTNLLRSNAFEVVGMDGENSVVLFFGDSKEDLQDWYECIHYNISILNQQEVDKQNSEMVEGEEKIRHMGHVYELLAANAQCSSWHRKFLVLRQAHVEIFSTVPQTLGEWMRPEKAYNLTKMTIELLKAKDGERRERIKLIAGVGDFHIFSFEHHDNIVAWTNNLLVATSLAVKEMKTARFPALWKNKEVVFIIDYNNGLSIQSCKDNKDILLQDIVWSKPFSKLRNTSDDGNRKLTMEFADSSKQVVELEDLNIVVCTMQAFLATRVADVDMGHIVQTGLISP